MQIQIDTEFQALIPPLSSDEYTQLEANILADGCRDALVTWGGLLIDGHNRMKICTQHSVAYRTIEKSLPDRQAAIEWIIRNQFGRRNLLPFQRCELALRLKPIIAARAKENQKLSEGRAQKGLQNSDNLLQHSESSDQKTSTGGTTPQLCQNSVKAEKIHTDDELSKLAGVSRDTISKVSVIQKEGTQQQLERAKKGGTGNTVHAIYQEIRQPEIAQMTKVCNQCGREKPVSEFRGGRAVCKQCTGSQNPIRDVKGEIIRETPETKALGAERSAQIAHDLYDQDKVIELTVDDALEEVQSLTDYYDRNVKMCINNYLEVIKTNNGEGKIIAALSEAEAAIKKIKELLS